MPREFLPQRRKREARTRSELFPRGERGVVIHAPPGLVAERRLVKRELRELAMDGINNEDAKALSTE